MSDQNPTTWRLRCRACNLTGGGLGWVTLLALRGGPVCSACGSAEVTAQDAVTGSAITFPRPAAPLASVGEWWQCCNCGGTGLDSYGDTCPHCSGLGNCQ